MYITIQVDRPMGQAIGIKEWLAMECERFGDARVIRVSEDFPNEHVQLTIPGAEKPGKGREDKNNGRWSRQIQA